MAEDNEWMLELPVADVEEYLINVDVRQASDGHDALTKAMSEAVCNSRDRSRISC